MKQITKKIREKFIQSVRNGKMPIYFSTGIFLALFGAMLIYLCKFTAGSQEAMINNDYNSRQKILLSRNYRGTIFSRDGDILAETVLDEDENEKRVYPYGSLFSHVVGYAAEGKLGIEALSNFYLINSNISIPEKVANSTAGKKNPGDDVISTLDLELQTVAKEQIALYQGAAIVTEVKTGKILALYSNPNFDPNKIEETWKQLITDKESSVLVNRVTQGLYPPGSTFKIVTALEYIRENPENYEDYQFFCRGYFESDSQDVIHCYNSISHGKVDLKKSFAKSCNSSFANIGVQLERESFSDTLDKLLFNQKLPCPLNYEKSTIAVRESTSLYDMMQTSIGQGKTLITPFHLNLITCAVANGGMLVKPCLVESVVNAEGKTVKTFEAENYGRLMSKEEAQILSEMMQEVVLSGTAHGKIGYVDYTVAGKTGSAEFGEEGESHAWFTAFAPVEDPQVAVTVLLEGVGGGGDYAVPVVRRLFDCYFEQNGYTGDMEVKND